MKEFLLGVYIGLGVIVAVAAIFGVIALIYFLAKHNVFFTLVQEGRAKAILRFKKFSEIVMAYKGYDIDDEWNVVPSQEEMKVGLFGGLKWVGIPLINSVHTYRFEWTSYEQIEKEGKTIEEPITKQEEMDYVLVQDDIYYTFIKEAETKGMVPVDVILLLTLKVVNPYKALFRIQHWLEATQNRLKPAFRSFIADMEFEEIVSRKEKVEEEINSFLARTKVDEFIKENYGVHLEAIEIVRVDPAGDRGTKFVEAATKRWEADKEKEKVLTLADAEVERMKKVYGKIVDYGDNGLAIKMMETMEKASEKQGNWFIPFPLQNLVKGLFGKKGGK